MKKQFAIAGIAAALAAVFFALQPHSGPAVGILPAKAPRMPETLPAKAPSSKPVVYLTLDGGPSEGFSEIVLPILKKHNCRVTWFVVGQYMARDTRAAGEISRAGHELEIHTWDHPYLTRLTDAQVQDQARRTADIITRQTGQRPLFVRPPYGDHSPRTDAALERIGYRVSMWDATFPDFRPGPPNGVVESIMRQARPGSVILLHVTHRTWQALPELLTRLDEKGFQYGLLRDRPRSSS